MFAQSTDVMLFYLRKASVDVLCYR